MSPVGLRFGKDQNRAARKALTIGIGDDTLEDEQAVFARRAGVHDQPVERLLPEAIQGAHRVAGKEDAVAQALADALFDDMNSQVVLSGIDSREYGEIQSVLFERVDNLTTQIRVKTLNDGIHYFTLKLTEHV